MKCFYLAEAVESEAMHLTLVILLGFALAVANGRALDEGEQLNFVTADGFASKLRDLMLTARSPQVGLIAGIGNTTTTAAHDLANLVFDSTSTFFSALAVITSFFKEVVTGAEK